MYLILHPTAFPYLPYFKIALLKQLMKCSSATVYCLVRSFGGKTGEERLAESQKSYKEFEFFQTFKDRIVVVWKSKG